MPGSNDSVIKVYSPLWLYACVVVAVFIYMCLGIYAQWYGPSICKKHDDRGRSCIAVHIAVRKVVDKNIHIIKKKKKTN